MWPFDRPPPDELAPGTSRAEAEAEMNLKAAIGTDEVDQPDVTEYTADTLTLTSDKSPPPPTIGGTSRK